jgi:2-polyprenyl-6-methoxyphenol hydroxylase-like FAD-dependent oxidoreductase
MKQHGVVIGGGIGGLLAAYVLAEWFKRVTILERDHYPHDKNSSAPSARQGVPQSRCLHLLTAAGAAAFDELISGWREEVVALGATPFDASKDAALHVSAGWLPRTPSGIVTYACSRALIEDVLRRGLVRKPNVRLREGQNVMGLLNSESEGVAGVFVADRHRGSRETLVADLVVDASGAGSKLPRWIAPMTGDPKIQLTKRAIESGMAFVSRWFYLEPSVAPDWHCLSAARTIDVPERAALMLRAENDHWGVVLLAAAGVPLPVDDAAFLEFAGGLCDGELRKALAYATLASPIYSHGPASNRMMHYDRLGAWPEGLVALGDSVCMLDPYFGLGMTTAAQGALLLRLQLRQADGTISASAFQRELALLNLVPWQMATGCDADGRPLSRDLPLLRRLYAAAPSRPDVAHGLLAVQHMLRSPETLMELESA